MGADWQTLATIHILVGYEADLLGLLPFRDGRKTVEGLLMAVTLDRRGPAGGCDARPSRAC